MTKAQLESAIAMLSGIVSRWNEAGEGRRRDDSIYLVLSGDESGSIGRGRPESECDDAYRFNDVRELVEILEHEYGVDLEDDPRPAVPFHDRDRFDD